ncbi:phosphotransferase family protein [Amycolatopsis acidiphila]|uniref:Phosphotransferase family protein n=1 Tax=Amycolatopsis acidiphila TaxID=715473 RepID=A0A558AM18_9PSEU|nr:phosphotransferase family protein [Amycolatopsis acidiphila]TVT25317.1 phosphotransferase family protein [Amycolatopsis acidiphila]UIJ62442.1 phosphotransferase family protein [Amycolatopsis acidiphila]GHG83715.1 acyl-CoA dehydrogenase [Amycolatopsis acidiphila]
MTWDWNDEQRDGLARFLAAHGICAGPVTTRRIGDGHSNLTFLVGDGQRQVVVRRPPPPPVPPGAHDVLREAKLIGALAGTSVPVAEVLAVAQAGEVIDVPFYVMSYVEGPVITSRTPDTLSTPGDRRRIGESLVDILAELHAVDWRARGLAGMGRPEGFNARHFRRMGRLIADEEGRPPAEFAEIDAWLAAHVPAEAGATVVHNDYRLGNVIVGPDSPGRIIAVLDWELATLGDPLFDVGYFLSSWPVAGESRTPTEDLAVAALEEGYPTRAELAARYASATGRDLSGLDWYTALALWKLAVLYEYGRRRAVRGVGDEYYADAALVKAFLTAAEQAAS